MKLITGKYKTEYIEEELDLKLPYYGWDRTKSILKLTPIYNDKKELVNIRPVIVLKGYNGRKSISREKDIIVYQRKVGSDMNSYLRDFDKKATKKEFDKFYEEVLELILNEENI